MLVQYTRITSLTADQLSRLKSSLRGMQLEGHGAHFTFEGLTLSTAELSAQKSVWESQGKGPNQVLLG